MQVKGTALRSILLGIERVGGPDALARVKATLPGDVLTQINGIVPSSWYPIELSSELQLAIRRELGHGTTQMNYRVGLEAAKVDFGGVYRAVLWSIDPVSALRRMDRAWRKYNSEGGVRWERLDAGDAVCHIEGVSTFHLAMWMAIAGRGEGVLKLCGATSAKVEITRHDSTSCTMRAQWTP